MVFGLGSLTLADVDLGFSQDMSNSSFRVDASNFVFEVPVKDELDEFSFGATVPFAFWRSYGIAMINLAEDGQTEKLGLKDMMVGVGYPIYFGDFTLRGELRASSPNWTEFKNWTYTPLLSIQFNFDTLLPE